MDREFVDSREVFDVEEYEAWMSGVQSRLDESAMEDGEDENGYGNYEDDGQPSEYEEWQDYYGGDVEEYGSYGEYDSGDW